MRWALVAGMQTFANCNIGRDAGRPLQAPHAIPPAPVCPCAPAGPRQEFPIFEDRMPTQMLTYVRLARIQDPAQLAKVGWAGSAGLGSCGI